MAHLLPFHRSTTGSKSAELVVYAPTAVQAVAEEHATLFRKMNWVPAGFGVRCIRHLVPFHRSTRDPALD
jgi:hypothetical protein